MSVVAILIPVLRRPHRIRPVYESAISATPDARVVFIANRDDQPTLDECEALLHEHLDDATCLVIEVPWSGGIVGDYARKVNIAYRNTAEDLLFLGADDLDFHPGWFEAATSRLNAHVQVVGTNDLGNPRVISGEHATHSLVTRRYADRYGTIDGPGAVLFEGYPHEYVDDEFVGTAKHRGAFAFAADSFVEHLHPAWGKAPSDVLYDGQTERMRRGWPLYSTRRLLWAADQN